MAPRVLHFSASYILRATLAREPIFWGASAPKPPPLPSPMNVLTNRDCGLKLSNIFIATSIVCALYCTNFTFCGPFVKYSEVVPGATIYKITRLYLNINYGMLSFNTTSISTFSATFVSEI